MHIYDYWYIITDILIKLGCILGDKDTWVAKVKTVTELAGFLARFMSSDLVYNLLKVRVTWQHDMTKVNHM